MRSLLLLGLFAVAACGKGAADGATCPEAGARFLDVVRRQLDDAASKGAVDDATRARIAGHAPAIRDAMVRACEDGKWSPATRGCFAAATSETAMTACYESLPPEQRALLDKASAHPSR